MAQMAKGAPNDATKILLCDLTSSAMWRSFPWTESRTNIPAGLILLADGVQDYDSPTNFFRLLDAYLMQTNLALPESNAKVDLEVEDDLAPNPRKAGWSSMRRIAMAKDVGRLRLDYTVYIKSPDVVDIRGQYQMQHSKVTTLAQGMWFKDDYLDVAVEGLNYWAYKRADDKRAGEAVTDGRGRITYTGQLATFMTKLRRMADTEQMVGTDQVYPAEGSIGSDIFSQRGWLYP